MVHTPSANARLFDTVGSVVGGTLNSDLVVDFTFAGSLQMYDPQGPVLTRPDDTIKGLISVDVVTAGGTAEMESAIGFFDVPWDMHDVSLSACSDFTVNADLFFDWNSIEAIPVFSRFRLKPMLNSDITSWQHVADGMVFTVEVIDTDNDGIPGHAMTVGPFARFTPSSVDGEGRAHAPWVFRERTRQRTGVAVELYAAGSGGGRVLLSAGSFVNPHASRGSRRSDRFAPGPALSPP